MDSRQSSPNRNPSIPGFNQPLSAPPETLRPIPGFNIPSQDFPHAMSSTASYAPTRDSSTVPDLSILSSSAPSHDPSYTGPPPPNPFCPADGITIIAMHSQLLQFRSILLSQDTVHKQQQAQLSVSEQCAQELFRENQRLREDVRAYKEVVEAKEKKIWRYTEKMKDMATDLEMVRGDRDWNREEVKRVKEKLAALEKGTIGG